MFRILIFYFFLVSMEAIASNFSNFVEEQTTLIQSQDSNMPMRVTQITNLADSLLLRSQCSDINPDIDKAILQLLLDRMYATVTDSNSLGVGIAAPQVGITKNIIWVQRFDKQGEPFEYYFNPKILKYTEKKQECREGCLSIPIIMDTLNVRAYAIMIQYDTFEKRNVIEMVEGFTAVIFQHEVDHLNGKLFIDYIKKEE
ncbi:MAG TPA: peptide deformylase [Candidatus Kapabacteria bacterium]|nr:peptide deformylase [Candidatus Kapabacteria bacterium]